MGTSPSSAFQDRSTTLILRLDAKTSKTPIVRTGRGGGGGGVLPYMGYIGMCGAKGYGFSAVLVINRVSILAILPPFW